MENSVLSDAAGVQKNISKMYEEHAQSIGKSTNALTQAEKAQAVYNGIMAETSMFTGSAAEMANGYQGQQAQLNAVNLEMSRTLGESMIPALTQYSTLQLSITKGLTEFIKNHKEVTSGIVTFTTTLLATIVALTAIKKAITAYKLAAAAAEMTTKAFTVALLTNPITLVAAGLAAAVGIFASYNTSLAESTSAEEKKSEVVKVLAERQLTYNDVLKGTIELNQQNADELKNTTDKIKEYIDDVNKYNQNLSELKTLDPNTENYEEKVKKITSENNKLRKDIKDLSEEFRNMFAMDLTLDDIETLEGSENVFDNIFKGAKKAGGGIEDFEKALGKGIISTKKMNKFLGEYSEKTKETNAMLNIKTAMDTESVKVQQQEAAELERNASRMQKYLNILKKGNTSTKEYQKAVKMLAKAYPEAVDKTIDGEKLVIKTVEECVKAEKNKAEQAWNNSQTTIRGNIETIESYIKLAHAAEEDTILQKQLAEQIGLSYEKIIPTLETVLNVLKAIGSNTPWGVLATDDRKVKIPKTSSVGSSKGSKSSKSYENKKLDNYIKLIEYKKSLDKLSLQQEIKMYQTALNKYAKTTDEKRNLRTKIYELNKELAQKEKDLLDQQTEDYETYIQKQKNLRGSAYDLTEQTKDYDKIIAMHQKYLKKIMKDKRLSLDERKELYREELQIVRDYEQQKRDLMVEQVDNTVSQLTNAITKQLEEAQEREKEAIDKNLEEVEKWKDARIDAINEEYDARIEAIEKELEALDKAEKQKTRDEEDAEHEKKKKRLEELIAFEHDATTKANYQKELDKLLEEYQKTLDKRALDDKKEALNEQKELLKEEQNNKTQAIEDEAEKQKEIYETQLEELEKYYDEQTKKAQETAEKMLLNVQKNQDKILELLKKYGDAYEITGQSLGEKIAQGIDKGLTNKIKGIIQKIQDTIDANIEAKVKEWTRSNYKYEASANKPKQTNINITQQNYIEQNPEMPSETYRKLKNVSEKLAEEIEGL